MCAVSTDLHFRYRGSVTLTTNRTLRGEEKFVTEINMRYLRVRLGYVRTLLTSSLPLPRLCYLHCQQGNCDVKKRLLIICEINVRYLF